MFSWFKKNKDKKLQEEVIEVPVYQPPEGSKNRSLKEIDTSYWKTKDKEWVTQRKEKWPKIEEMLYGNKTTKGLNIIKAYYLRGKMPNWDTLATWDENTGHLDAFVFLWLHPSWNESLLKELRDLYIKSDLIIKRDLYGIGGLLGSQTQGPLKSIDESYHYPYIEGHGEMLFSVLLGDPIQGKYQIVNPEYAKRFGKEISYPLDKGDGRMLSVICSMSVWLCNEMKYTINQDFIFQYDKPLEWWYQNSYDDDYIFVNKYGKRSLPQYPRFLSRIHCFDIEKEGDTCRTSFVLKLRKILDERAFHPEFKQMWEDVKSGKTTIENPCEE